MKAGVALVAGSLVLAIPLVGYRGLGELTAAFGCMVGGTLIVTAGLLRRVRIGSARITGLCSVWRARTIDLASATVETRGEWTIVRDGARAWRFTRAQIRNFEEVVTALRARVRPEAWNPGKRASAKGRWQRFATRAATYGYRDEASARTAELPGWCTTERGVHRRRIVLAVLALVAGVLTMVLNPPPPSAPRGCPRFIEDERPPPPLSDLFLRVGGGTLALASFLGLVPAFGALSTDRALRWLAGPPTPAGPRAARHGLRRVRISSSHPSSRIGVVGQRREMLDAHERTIQCRRVWGCETIEAEAPLLLRSVAVLPRSIDSLRHLEEVKRTTGLGGPIVRSLGAARVLVIDVHSDGVLLHRFSESRGHVGDTWHPTREHALSQIEDEYGARDLAFRDVPVDPNEGPIAFFAHVDLGDASRNRA